MTSTVKNPLNPKNAPMAAATVQGYFYKISKTLLRRFDYSINAIQLCLTNYCALLRNLTFNTIAGQTTYVQSSTGKLPDLADSRRCLQNVSIPYRVPSAARNKDISSPGTTQKCQNWRLTSVRVCCNSWHQSICYI
jgi:hypothetical protein